MLVNSAAGSRQQAASVPLPAHQRAAAAAAKRPSIIKRLPSWLQNCSMNAAGEKNTLNVSVMFFARARELVGCSEGNLAVPAGANSAALPQLILAAYPKLATVLPSCMLSLNLIYLDAKKPTALKAGDEVGVICPVSGG